MSTFYTFFALYIFLGLLISGALFYWAVVNGQFHEQDRARYLPLGGEAVQPKSLSTARWPRSMIVTVVCIITVLIAQVVALMTKVFAR